MQLKWPKTYLQRHVFNSINSPRSVFHKKNVFRLKVCVHHPHFLLEILKALQDLDRNILNGLEVVAPVLVFFQVLVQTFPQFFKNQAILLWMPAGLAEFEEVLHPDDPLDYVFQVS